MQKKTGIIREKKGFICDMDGVLYHGERLLPGVNEFINWLKGEKKKYLFLTNSSERTQAQLHDKMLRLGIDVPRENFYTSAIATASFLASQDPGGSYYAIGEDGLHKALEEVGFSQNDKDPDYVIVGSTRESYTFDAITNAINLVLRGAKLIGTNSDLTGPIEGGIDPGTKALIAPIELATGRTAYFVGKPNPLMMRHALKIIECPREKSIIIGDRMDTDIIAGIESEIDTLLVLSGVTDLSDLELFPYKPHYILNGVGEIVTDN